MGIERFVGIRTGLGQNGDLGAGPLVRPREDGAGLLDGLIFQMATADGIDDVGVGDGHPRALFARP